MILKIFILVLIILLVPQIYFSFKNGQKERNVSEVFIKGEDFSFLGSDNLFIHGKIYKVSNPKAIVQIIHGALEHKDRYIEIIRFLNNNGYSAVICDNRGHGESTNERYPFGHFNNLSEIIEDQIFINNYIRMHSQKNIYMLGHSLGSMFARVFLQENDFRIQKLVLTGTVSYNPLVYLGIFIGNIINFYGGPYGKSKILNKLYEGNRSEDWLSYNKENLKEVKNDPYMLPNFTNKGALTVFNTMKELKNYGKYKCKNKNLKILSITGIDDEVVGGKRGILDTVRTLKKIGYKNIEYKIIPKMKHEVLRENNKEKVFNLILEFFEG